MFFCTGMYSCIAGFMDPGEPLEECVRREVAEEVALLPNKQNIWRKKENFVSQVGLEVGEVSYIGSQHWPFPAGSVMIGCHAQVGKPSFPDVSPQILFACCFSPNLPLLLFLSKSSKLRCPLGFARPDS